MNREILYKNIPADEIIIEEEPQSLPGEVRDLRISLTSLCNLRCPHCHNEGQPPPWVIKAAGEKKPDVTVLELLDLLKIGKEFDARLVKFTGGEPSYYHYFNELLEAIADGDWGKMTFGVATNGTPFLSTTKLRSLIDSPLFRVHVGLDSIRGNEKSKPTSPVGIEGRKLLENMIIPLWNEWKEQGKEVVINTVFTGDKDRIIQILDRAIVEGITTNVIEVNGVMGTKYETRQAFLNLLFEVMDRFGLNLGMDEVLNQTYLTDEDRVVFRFYQDHCADGDCGHCRKIHMRVNSTSEGFMVIPCFLKTQGKGLSITSNGVVDVEKFKDAIRVMGTGPDWQTKK